MNTGGHKSENMTQQTLLVFIIAAASLYAIGNLAMAVGKRFIGHLPLTPNELAQFVYSGAVSPKPLERLVFLSVTLSVAPVLALATFLVRRFDVRITLPAFNLSVGLVPAASYRAFPKPLRIARRMEWLAMGLVLIFAIYAGGYYRWFGADEVDYKFTAPESFDAIIFSIMRISQGGTCLVDVMPQYGCYGEFFRPLWAVVTPSVKAITTVFFILYLAAIFAAMRFSSRVIRRPEILVLTGVALIVLNSFYGFFDVYLQYWPLRTLFPCFALWLATIWQDGPNAYKAAGLGVFSTLAISWNLDSGVPVFLSLAILIALCGCTRASSLGAFFSRPRLLHLSIYCLGAAVMLTMIFGYLSIKAGALADAGLYIHYQRIFYIAGFLMLPMPALPHLWGVVISIILFALAALATRTLRGRLDNSYELIGFAAILAIGCFVYYTGRSHIRVLELVSWLPLILAFCLVDRASDCASKTANNALRWIAAGGTVLFVTVWLVYYGNSIDDRWAAQLDRFGHAATLDQDAGFIARETKPGDKVAVLAPSQGSLIMTSGRTLDWSGPGITETLLWADAKETMKTLHDRGPRNLFIDPRIRSGEPYATVFSVYEADIRAAYVTRAWEANGRILHMMRRQTTMDRDVVPYDHPLQVKGGHDDFPLQMIQALNGPFDLEMNIIARPQQASLAILASSTEMDLDPFQGLVIYHQAQMGNDRWALAMGTGSAWKQTPAFTLPSGHPVLMRISYAAPKLEIALNGKTVFSAANFVSMSPTLAGLYIGDWIAHIHRADRPTDLPLSPKFGSPNDWKIQDRRFDGEIISARLLP